MSSLMQIELYLENNFWLKYENFFRIVYCLIFLFFASIDSRTIFET